MKQFDPQIQIHLFDNLYYFTTTLRLYDYVTLLLYDSDVWGRFY